VDAPGSSPPSCSPRSPPCGSTRDARARDGGGRPLVPGAVGFGSLRRPPSTGGAAEIGAYLGLCVLTRTDLVALVVLVGLPLAVFARSASWLERGKFVVVLLAVVVLVVARGRGATSRRSRGPHSCPTTQVRCSPVPTAPRPTRGHSRDGGRRVCGRRSLRGNQPAVAAEQLAAGRHYASSHEAALVGVAAERVGRLWGVVDPIAGARLEA